MGKRVLCLLLILLMLPVFAFASPSSVTRALLVGVDDFVSMERLSPAAGNNVDALRQVLSEGADSPLITTVSGADVPETSSLSRKISEVFTASSTEDTLLFYICTHGVNRSDTPSGLLLSDGAAETVLTPQALAEMLAPFPGRKLVLIDACCSGAFAEGPLPNAGITVLTSCGGAESSWYWTDAAGGAQGSFYFTSQLCFGISAACGFPADRDRDGAITAEECYQYLLENHGASTPRLSVSGGDLVLCHTGVSSAEKSALRDISFSADAVSTGEGASITLDFTVTRPVCVAYQLVRWTDDRWDFSSAEILYDGAERYAALGSLAGAVTAGRKSRTIDLSGLGEGYLLIQLISLDEGKITVHAGHCVALLGEGAPFSAQAALKDGILTLSCSSLRPCRLSVTLIDRDGNTVRRLITRRASRPDPNGSFRGLFAADEDFSGLRLLVKAEYAVGAFSLMTPTLP